MKNIFWGSVAFLFCIELSHGVSEFDVGDVSGFERLFSLSVLPASLNENYESSDSEMEHVQDGLVCSEDLSESVDENLESPTTPTTPIMNADPDDVYSSPEI